MPLIIVRFNPDSYILKGKKYNLDVCFGIIQKPVDTFGIVKCQIFCTNIITASEYYSTNSDFVQSYFASQHVCKPVSKFASRSPVARCASYLVWYIFLCPLFKAGLGFHHPQWILCVNLARSGFTTRAIIGGGVIPGVVLFKERLRDTALFKQLLQEVKHHQIRPLNQGQVEIWSAKVLDAPRPWRNTTASRSDSELTLSTCE